MKRIIVAIALLWCTVALSATNATAKARTHKTHKTHKAHVAHIASAAHPNIVKPFPRPEDEASVLPLVTPSCDDACMVADTAAFTRTSNTAYMCPSLDTTACNVPASFGLTTTQPAAPVAITDQSINNYYYAKAVYEPPATVTVNGFTVPVKGNPLYYSPFKHRDGAPMPLHNSKGVDETAGVGVSPRASGFPESIGNWPNYANTPPSR